jgi:hypothetical protein
MTLLAKAEAEIDFAARGPVALAPAALSRAVAMLQPFALGIRECSGSRKATLQARMILFQRKLAQLRRNTDRSQEIFRGYCRLAGFGCGEYGPAGLADPDRDPAFFTLTV